MNLYLAQALCGPARHALVALPFEDEREELPEEPQQKFRDILFHFLDEAIAGRGPDPRARKINPWCELCHAPREQWIVEIGKTRFATLEEALPALLETQRQNLEAQEHIKAMRRAAKN